MSDFLFSTPSLLSGAARVIDIGGQLDNYNASATPQEADRRSSACDWNAVAKDILSAARLVAAEESVQEAEQTPA